MFGVEEDMYDQGVKDTINKVIAKAEKIRDEDQTTEGGCIALGSLIDYLEKEITE